MDNYFRLVPPTPLAPISWGHDKPPIWCKLDFMQPSGSTKDRIARHILGKAMAAGRLSVGQRVVEASSGSSAVAFALACAQLGMRFVAVMPEGVSPDRVRIIRAYGGEVRLTPRSAGVIGAVAESVRIAKEGGGFLPSQFDNPDNAEAHRIYTAGEILSQIPDGAADAVVSGVGTGGTLVGLHAGLSAGGRKVRAFVARPVEVPEGLEAECCCFGQCGAFSSRIPGVVECASKIFRDARIEGVQILDVSWRDAMRVTRDLIRRGFPVGPSSGLNFRAAELALKVIADSGAKVVTVFPDRMERYLSGDLFADLDSRGAVAEADSE